MDYSTILDLLSEEISKSRGLAPRTIIRFRSQDDYRQCESGILSRPEMLASIKPLSIIHGFSCSLEPDSAARLARDELIIERDESVSLSPRSILPIPLQSPPKPYDAKHRIPWGVKQIEAPKVWKTSKGRHVNIGVIDTGADFNHPDLRGRLARGVNLLNRLSLPSDDNGHGTHIIGTIAAANKESGIVGVAPQAVIYPIKAFDRNGSAFITDIIQGIDWCVANHLNIINMSFGMKGKSDALLEAVQNAYRSGVIIVASSGNDGHKGTIDYPARFPHTIAVGATTRNREVAPFSNRSKFIDVYAPGEAIFSTWIGGQYNELSGTSMATSHVTGVIALLMSARPGLRPKQIKDMIRRSITPPKKQSNRIKAVIHGLLNAPRALRLLNLRRTAPPRRKKAAVPARGKSKKR